MVGVAVLHFHIVLSLADVKTYVCEQKKFALRSDRRSNPEPSERVSYRKTTRSPCTEQTYIMYFFHKSGRQ
jgi:hypothetical protein